jgi:hypothetical protein
VTLTPGGAGSRAIALHNFYVPSGGDEPDPIVNPKFAHKLAFLDEMADWMAAERIAGSGAIMAGDLNIAPLETDVWNHKALLRVVSRTPVGSKNSIWCATRDRGPMRSAIMWRATRRSTRGGAIARGTGKSPTEGGGSTMFGSVKASSRISMAPASYASAVAGSRLPITCRRWSISNSSLLLNGGYLRVETLPRGK